MSENAKSRAVGGEGTDPRPSLREHAKSRAHAHSLFQGGFGGPNDNEAVWYYAEEIHAEALAKPRGEGRDLARAALRELIEAIDRLLPLDNHPLLNEYVEDARRAAWDTQEREES